MSVLTNSGLSHVIDKITLLFSKKNHQHTVSDISNFPDSLPANGGNAETVNNHTVNSDVPSNAKFTDTTYSKLSEFTDDVGYVTNTDTRLSDARPASDVYAWAKATTPDDLFDGGTYTGNIDSYTESALRPGKSYYISTSNISSSLALPFSGYGILTSYVAGSVIIQQIFKYNGSSKIIDGIYTRMYINKTWTSWSKVALTKV